MAAWQFDVYLVPRAALKEISAGSDRIDADVFENKDLWRSTTLPASYRQLLTEFTRASSEVADDWTVFGEQEGDRVDVLANGDRVEEVRARVDVRELNAEFIEGLIRFASICDCALISEQLHVIEPTLEALWVEIELSPAAMFVSNPRKFLGDLRKGRRSE